MTPPSGHSARINYYKFITQTPIGQILSRDATSLSRLATRWLRPFPVNNLQLHRARIFNMPYRKIKSKEAYGMEKHRRLKQLHLARAAKRSADESTTSTAMMSAPKTKKHCDGDVEQIQRSSSSSNSDSDKEVFIDMFFRYNDTYLHEIH